MKILEILSAIVTALFCCPDIYCDGAVSIELGTLEAELPTIKRAAILNNCRRDNFLILLAIRKAENGRSGCEFGIKHSRAWDTDLYTQARWAAATIIKNRRRWMDAGRPGEFIDFLGDRYCQATVDPQGNKNWKKNVKFWFEKLNGN